MMFLYLPLVRVTRFAHSAVSRTRQSAPVKELLRGIFASAGRRCLDRACPGKAASRPGYPSIIAFLCYASVLGAAHEVQPRAVDDATVPRAADPVSVIELQPERQSRTVDIGGAGSTIKRQATLINLNPTVNAWYLLRLDGSDGKTTSYHLENSDPRRRTVHLEAGFPGGLVIQEGTRKEPCPLWGENAGDALETARRVGVVYAPLCQGQLYLRNRTKGNRTPKETVTDFLRDRVAGGEKIVGYVKDTLFKDRYLETSEPIAGDAIPNRSDAAEPLAALVKTGEPQQLILPANLGIELESTDSKGMVPGRWYRAKGVPGIYLSAINPNLIAEEILRGHRDIVAGLDGVELKALVYLVAFDLSLFDLGFALGTEHPRVGWSDRVQEKLREKNLPGPDGIERIAPLVATGIIDPENTPKAVASFTGGFKRQHGAFRWGALGERNRGSHYGFIENGVILSTLQPGLATVYILDDGTVEMKTWESNTSRTPRIKHARQNGVPIIEHDESAGSSMPGPLVARWGPGNWSGSADKQLRTLRAGLCLQQEEQRRFLIYGYFSSSTPSGMARVFQAYRCKYAMLLDMNALEHTYLAIYRRDPSGLSVQHVIRDMKVLDKSVDGNIAPRFLGFSDNRDFFYLTRKESQ